MIDRYIFPFISWFPSSVAIYVNYLFIALTVAFVIGAGILIGYIIVRVYQLKTPVKIENRHKETATF